MNRKFTNSLSALTATSATLVAIVVFALNPLSPELSADPVMATSDGMQPASASRADAGALAPRATGGGSGRHVRTLAMPYFSLVPRG